MNPMMPVWREALEPLGGEDRCHAREALLDIVVDQDIVIAVPVADFVRRTVHAGLDHLGRIGRAAFEPLAQLGHRGRQDEHAHDIAAGELVKLLRALPVDVEQDVAALLEHVPDLRLGRAVAMAEDMRPFEEFVVRDHRAEGFEIDEVIIDAVHFAGAHRSRRVGNRDDQLGLVLAKLARDRGFASARGRGKNEEHTAAFEAVRIGVGGVHAR